MSHSRVHDLLLLLASSLVAAGCTERDDPGIDGGGEGAEGADPDQQDALSDALDVCRPYARTTSACYAEAYGSEYDDSYVSQVGFCLAQVGYYTADAPDCADAFGDYFACLAELDCDQLLGTGDDDGGEPSAPHPCDPVSDALEVACDFGSEDSEPGDPGSDT